MTETQVLMLLELLLLVVPPLMVAFYGIAWQVRDRRLRAIQESQFLEWELEFLSGADDRP
jgi:hypothetical protein